MSIFVSLLGVKVRKPSRNALFLRTRNRTLARLLLDFFEYLGFDRSCSSVWPVEPTGVVFHQTYSELADRIGFGDPSFGRFRLPNMLCVDKFKLQAG